LEATGREHWIKSYHVPSANSILSESTEKEIASVMTSRLDSILAPTFASYETKRLNEKVKPPFNIVEKTASKTLKDDKYVDTSNLLDDIGETNSTSTTDKSLRSSPETFTMIATTAVMKPANHEDCMSLTKLKLADTAFHLPLMRKLSSHPVLELDMKNTQRCTKQRDQLSIDDTSINDNNDISALSLARDYGQPRIEDAVASEHFVPVFMGLTSSMRRDVLGLESGSSGTSPVTTPDTLLANNESRKMVVARQDSVDIATASQGAMAQNRITASIIVQPASKTPISNDPKRLGRTSEKRPTHQNRNKLICDSSVRCGRKGSISKKESDRCHRPRKSTDRAKVSRKLSSPSRVHRTSKESKCQRLKPQDGDDIRDLTEKRQRWSSNLKHKGLDNMHEAGPTCDALPICGTDNTHLWHLQSETKSSSLLFDSRGKEEVGYGCCHLRGYKESTRGDIAGMNVVVGKVSDSREMLDIDDLADLNQKKILWQNRRRQWNSNGKFDHIIKEMSLELLESQETSDFSMETLFGVCNEPHIGRIQFI
jgi:hypothetical protein